MLTRKNNEIAKIELDAGYQNRFENELTRLGGKRLQVRPESKQQGKGRITFGLALKGAKKSAEAQGILSEGEARVVALAAFLADISASGQPTPFVFDDPISSLDQDFEERVVARLVELSELRQVIVFTHRLSLVTLVGDLVKRIDEQAKLKQAPSLVKLNVEALRRLGNQIGLVTELNIRDSKPLGAIKRMRDEIIPKLKKLHEAGDVVTYDEQIKGVCSDFRILVERSVENVLLNDVLVRFRRSVQTQGRIASLAKIEKSDCAFIDDLMTRYSAFEHSQPEELPAEVPDLVTVEADVKKMAEWIDEFGKRIVA